MNTEEMRARLWELLHQRDMLLYERGEPELLYELRQEIEDLIQNTQRELRMMEWYEGKNIHFPGN